MAGATRHVPTEAEIDAMDEEELEAYLNQADEPARAESRVPEGDSVPSGADTAPAWLRAAGSSRLYAWLLVACGLIGIVACWELILAEMQLLKEPLAGLTCDINPFVACGASLDTWQGNLLGVPNAFVGAMAFAALTLIGLVLASGGRLPRWLWWGLVAGTVGGIAFVAWFLFESITFFGKLCPYCMVIWAVTIPAAAGTWAEAAHVGALGLSRKASQGLVAARWWIAGGMYTAVLVVLLAAFWDGWVSLLR